MMEFSLLFGSVLISMLKFFFENFSTFIESLILAQDERWRRG